MLFNSFEFAVFLPIVFAFYWLWANKNLIRSNVFLLLSSYLFYGWWDYRFLLLILISSVADFLIGQYLGRTEAIRKRKLLLWSSVLINLTILGFFKYFNFFIGEFSELIGIEHANKFSALNVILPVGISFYTFQTLSYTIDIYRGRLQPTNDYVAFFAFISFFPQLVAGPIERAAHLLPQFMRKRKFHYGKAKDGIRQVLWGLFKKMVIADSAASLVQTVFGNIDGYGTVGLALGLFLFAIQIYCDFSGYSDIAIGTARLFGFDLKRNFAFPYFSRDVGEFWRRWHISLSTWFRDYLYIPLGGSKVDNNWKLGRNIFAIFLISGLWHGANWTYIVWGLIHALFFLPAIFRGRNRRYHSKSATTPPEATWKDLPKMAGTFILVCLAWTFFRAETLTDAFLYLVRLFTHFSFDMRIFRKAIVLIFAISLTMAFEWWQRDKEHAFQLDQTILPKIARSSIYLVIAMAILLCTPANKSAFIYFQF